MVVVTSFTQIDPDPKKITIPTYQIKKNLSLRNATLKLSYSLNKKKAAEPDTEDFNNQYTLVFEDNFDSLNTKKWRLGQAWGEFHPGYPHQYYAKEMISTKDGYLHLRGQYAPKTFRSGDSNIVIPLAVGLINSDISFKQKFGYFEIRSKNPSGPATWPAFWLTGANKWPPEIDIFEMYGKADGKNIHNQYATIHYGQTDTKSRGYLTRKIKLPDDTDSSFHVYACEWTSDYIRFYTDGRAVAHFRMNKRLQDWMNDEMVVIINNSFEPEFTGMNQGIESLSNDFIIDYIRVYKRKD